MRLTLLCMISANSLSAFSSATASAPLNRPQGSGGVQQARLLRGGDERPSAQAQGPAAPLPTQPPKGPLPRGSLLNLAV